MKMESSVSLTRYSPVSPKERRACKGSILSEAYCRKITRQTIHFTLISYALEEMCAAEEAYSLIHLALDDTHHG